MLSRRRFINGVLGAGLTASQISRAVAAPEKKRLIVDSQAHLWKAETEDWKWVPGIKPQLPEPFMIEKLVSLMDEAGVDRVVVVPPSWPGDRNDYGLEAARRYPDRFRVMGRIPLQDPKSAELLPTWKQQTGMLGVRLTFFGPSVPWLSDGTADWFWPAAEKAGIPVMFLAPGQLATFAKIAERHPQLTLIIDHMGIVGDVETVGKSEAIGATAALAKFPNVSVKLTAVPYFSKEPYPFHDYDEPIKRLFDAYGPQRCYWGTDITSSYDKATYKQRVTHFTEELKFLSEEDKDWVMGRAILARLGWA